MTKNYEFNENLAITDNDTHNAVVEKLNSIEEFAKSKKFEWEDEEIPEDTFGFTTNLNEWAEQTEDAIRTYYKHWHFDAPENLKSEILEYESKIRDYIVGYLMMPAYLYNKTANTVQRRTEKTLEDIVSFVKELKENNQKVFLYWICHCPQREVDQVVEVENIKSYHYKRDPYYILRYGVYND